MLMVGEYLTDYNPLTILYHYSFIKSMSFWIFAPQTV